MGSVGSTASASAGSYGADGLDANGMPGPGYKPDPPTGVPATYPLKSNALDNDPACRGFTLENYKTKAFQGGGDTQLYSMCGQAFDIYNSYLNARRKGYSEKDANITWSAHALAAKNASTFYKNTNTGGGIRLP
jgi:hypothetical protein